ncbi:ABC transporter ATP-binding protein [Plantactinospora sp. KLBMP9567]|uniref:ABC transporter ATP-binding protein n=1 Tax=Plantactinospora sp. KLBMP9567 TaxID=3085900 RepID=UPI002980A6DD|nr:ABC transporter ATP-binding protein [Plantactinospora sp. KLBMP9567]MDW5324840.1 ABC transporter ATP-binding protein [Plantactinospora sp. KLBMP9567]
MRVLRERLGVLRHVLRLSLRADRRTVFALFGLMVGQAGIVAGTGLSQRWLIDTALTGRVGGVLAAVAVGALAYGLGTAGGRIQTNMLIYLTDRVQVAVSQEVLRFVAVIPTLDHLERADYLDRLERLRWGTWGLAGSFWQAVAAAAAVVSLLATTVLLAAVHPALCLLAVFAVPSLLTTRRSAAIMRDTYDSTAELSRWDQRLHELCLAPEAAKELAIAGAGPELGGRAAGLWRTVTTRLVRAQLRAAAWEVAGWVCFAAGFLTALWILAGRVAEGTATLGDAVLLITLATQLQAQLGQVVGGVAEVAAAGHVIDHYVWLRDYAARPGGGDGAGRRLTDGIVLTGVSFRYPGADRDTLDDVSLRLPPGRTVAFVGVNGAGKSTLVKLLTGLYHPTRGSITVDGRPLNLSPPQRRDGCAPTSACGHDGPHGRKGSLGGIDPNRWHGSVTAVFQDFARFQFRAREAVGVGDLARLRDEAAVRDAVRRAGAEELLTELPHGLDTQLGTAFDGIEPSLGQWQKLALARALMRPAPLLTILDEPTAALDPQAEHDLFTGFAGQAAALAAEHGTVTVFVSHRFSTVRLADLIVVLDDGRIVETGSHAELMRHDGRYAALYRIQAGAYQADSAGRPGRPGENGAAGPARRQH